MVNITTKQILEWKELYESDPHMTYAEIGSQYSVKKDLVRYYLKRMGTKTLKNKILPPKHKLYQNKYIICVYDENENLCYQFDNAMEMAQKLNKSTSSVYTKLNEQRRNGKLRINNKWYYIVLVEVE